MNLIKNQQSDIDKFSLYANDLLELKYQLLINGIQKVRIKKLKNPKAFIDYWQTIDDVYVNLEDYNPMNKRKVLIMFDNIMEDMESNEKPKSYCYWIIFKRKKTRFACFLPQSYFKVPETIRLNATFFYYENS